MSGQRRQPTDRPQGEARAGARRTSARRIAFEVLSAHRVRSQPGTSEAGSFGHVAEAASASVADAASISRRAAGPPHVTQLLDDRLSALNPPPAERRLATELVLGVVRRRATLETILAAFVSRPRENIESGLWTLLELGVYQLALLSSIPPHAAVHETVQIAGDLRRPEWRGFLNGVLRSIGRSLTDELLADPSADAVPITEPSRPQPPTSPLPLGEGPGVRVSIDETLPSLSPLVRYRRFDTPLFPDPADQPGAYLAAAFSYPRWIVDRWLRRDGFDEALRLAAWFDTAGAMSLRVNLLRTDRDKVLEVLAASGVEATPGELPESVRLLRSIRVEDVPGFAEGWFSVQDESAMDAAALLDPQPGERVLDLCAAPGGKTAHLAERMRNTGEITACDVNERRLARVREGSERLGLTIIAPRVVAADGSDSPEGPFDAALVDVPCSNTGVLGKRADVRWRIGPHDLDELPGLQRRLLERAIASVRPGGRIVYSTCSSEPEENEDVVRTVAAADARVQVMTERRHIPGRPGDGGYQSLLKKL